MCAAVHLRPPLPKNNSENVWELEAFELQQTSTSWPMNSCAIGVAVQCRPRRHFLRSLSPATEHAKLVYAQVMGWVRIRTQFAIFRAVDLRLRGTRRSIQGMFLSDGAAVGVGY